MFPVTAWRTNQNMCFKSSLPCKQNQMLMDQMLLQIGNWSRWLQDKFGMVAAAPEKHGQAGDESDDRSGAADFYSFKLLNELSDLLMLPKDMLLEKSIRKEVSIHA